MDRALPKVCVMPQAPTVDLIGSAQACTLLGIDRSTLSRWVASGRLPLAMRLAGPNGALLFHRADVAALVGAK
jgi:excisionase family DNA binding protein